MSKEKQTDKKPKKTIWQRLDIFSKPWYIWVPVVFVLYALADEPFKAAGINHWIAWVAGTLIILIVFVVIGILAREDAIQRGTYEEDYPDEQEDFSSYSHNLQETDVQSFEEDIKEGLVLVDFWASWCAPCRKMHPVLEAISEQVPALTVLALDTGQRANEYISAEHKVLALPTMILFRDGKEIDRFVGALSEKKLRTKLQKHLES